MGSTVDLALYHSTEEFDLHGYVDFYAPHGTVIPAPLKACKMCVYSYDLYDCSNCVLWKNRRI